MLQRVHLLGKKKVSLTGGRVGDCIRRGDDNQEGKEFWPGGDMGDEEGDSRPGVAVRGARGAVTWRGDDSQEEKGNLARGSQGRQIGRLSGGLPSGGFRVCSRRGGEKTWRGDGDAGGLLERAQQEVDEVVGGALLEQALRGQAARRQRGAAHQHDARAGALRRLVLADALRATRRACIAFRVLSGFIRVRSLGF